MKYQFCIRFENTTTNSAATKAVLDCNKIFSDNGYKDYTFTVWDNSNRLKYYLLLIKELCTFYLTVKKSSIVGIQYPLLSVNSVFKYFIKLARLKKVKFFCVIHDLESLRTGGKDSGRVQGEIDNLNAYDCVIVHNLKMLNWLQSNGLKSKAVNLQLFDYLSNDFEASRATDYSNTILYAGNLVKSTFVYSLNKIYNWNFKVYGPNFQPPAVPSDNLTWDGEYSPEEIVTKLNGDFGLIWDGNSIDTCDEILGNYLRYNNPHKFSLYIAAGLPVIAPKTSAISSLILEHHIGFLVDSLRDLDDIAIEPDAYTLMKNNIKLIRERVIAGRYFDEAIKQAEKEIG